MSEINCDRRTLIGAAASFGVFGVAGCMESSGEGTPEEGGTATGDASTATSTDEPADTDTDEHSEDGHHGGEEDDHSGEDDHHSGEDDHHGGVGEPTATDEVAMETTDEGRHFAPHVVRVTEGGTVTFRLESGAHSTTAYHPDNGDPRLVPDGAASWDSGVRSETGAEFEQTFETPGVYHYYCQPHRSSGMVGSVVVGDPDPAGQAALGDPPESLSAAERSKIQELNGTVRDALSDEG